MSAFRPFLGLLLAAFVLLPGAAYSSPRVTGPLTALDPDVGPQSHLLVRTASKTRTKAIARTSSPTVVKGVRFRAYPNYTRVVLDLQRPVTLTESRRLDPDRVILQLKNSKLGKAAKASLKDKTFPDEVHITQSRSSSVTVALDLDMISNYKLLRLKGPDRLVVDIITPAHTGSNGKGPVATIPKSAAKEAKKAPLPSRTIQTIVLDPGHGGKDPGAIGRSGLAEKDITLAVARRVNDLIKKKLGKRVVMTRTKDVFVGLEDRAELANKHGADLFVSIHVNSHSRRSTRGVEVYHFGEASDPGALEVAARENGTPLKDTGVGWQYLVADLLTTKKVEDSLDLAWTTRKAMVNRLERHYNITDHGVKTAPFYVLRFTSMPGILTEIGFISNPTEEKRMKSKTFLDRVAWAIYDGIRSYVNTIQTVRR
ncbi:MAG: N-acetylmuramoyl-L-alanine amidase [Nitrospiraceae bacterium]